MKEDRVLTISRNEPTRGIGGIRVDGKAEAVQGCGKVDESVLLKGDDPFVIICQRGVDTAVAFGGGGDALVPGDDSAGAVFGETHGAVINQSSVPIYRRVIHVKRKEYVRSYEFRIGLVSGPFDDEGKQAEAGVAVPEAGAGRKISRVMATDELENIRVGYLGSLRIRDEGLIVFNARRVGEEVADEDVPADRCGEFRKPMADGILNA